MNDKIAEKSKTEVATDKHRQYLLPAVANYYKQPLVLESGSGMTVKDVEGREYLDFFGGILTVSVGHCDERVNQALKAQIDRLGHVSSLRPRLSAVELAEWLANITPGSIKKSIFSPSGTEAVDTAVV